MMAMAFLFMTVGLMNFKVPEIDKTGAAAYGAVRVEGRSER